MTKQSLTGDLRLDKILESLRRALEAKKKAATQESDQYRPVGEQGTVAKQDDSGDQSG
jgi:hypothetical protein